MPHDSVAIGTQRASNRSARPKPHEQLISSNVGADGQGGGSSNRNAPIGCGSEEEPAVAHPHQLHNHTPRDTMPSMPQHCSMACRTLPSGLRGNSAYRFRVAQNSAQTTVAMPPGEAHACIIFTAAACQEGQADHRRS